MEVEVEDLEVGATEAGEQGGDGGKGAVDGASEERWCSRGDRGEREPARE